MRSPDWTPLLFIAGGTGFAPVLALLEQQVKFDAARDMILIWGMRHGDDFYALDSVKQLLAEAPNLRVVLATESGRIEESERMTMVHGSVLNVLRADVSLLTHRDIYAAGPPMMLRELSRELSACAIDASRIHMDSFGI